MRRILSGRSILFLKIIRPNKWSFPARNAVKQGQTITFFEFMKVGVPLTVLQVLVYWGWLAVAG